jgi:hypothetical protein
VYAKSTNEESMIICEKFSSNSNALPVVKTPSITIMHNESIPVEKN